MNKLFAPFLPPWAETGLQPAFYDLESGTVLQQTSRMYAKVQQLIRLFNELSEETKTTVEEYIAKFVELKEFVDDYFENLDVQEEINNKLDELVEDGTLADIINNQIFKDINKSSIEVYHPDTVYFGDMSLIHFKYMNEDKYMIIDFYDDPTNYVSTNYDLLVNDMVSKGFSKFDYAVITHYHKDHVGCLSSFLDDARLDFSEATFYIPPELDWDSYIGDPDYIPALITSTLAKLEAKGIPTVTVTNSTEVNVNDETSFKFYNADTDAWTPYYADTYQGNTIYNNFSIVTEVSHLNNKLLFTGDIQKIAENVVLTQGVSTPAYLKVPHHGINGMVYSSPSFVQRCQGSINASCMPASNLTNVQPLYSAFRNFYVTGYSNNIHIYSDGYAVQATSTNGVYKVAHNSLTQSYADNSNHDNYYLDEPTTGYQIASGTDLNDVITPSTYGIGSAEILTSLLNAPPAYLKSSGKLYVNKITNLGRIKQIFEPIGNSSAPYMSTIYYRYGYPSENKWSEWVCDKTNGFGVLIAKNADLDNLTTGDYQSSSVEITATLSNVPTGVTGGFTLNCKRIVSISDRYIQTLIPNTAVPTLYMRTKTGSGWSNWYSFTGTELS